MQGKDKRRLRKEGMRGKMEEGKARGMKDRIVKVEEEGIIKKREIIEAGQSCVFSFSISTTISFSFTSFLTSFPSLTSFLLFFLASTSFPLPSFLPFYYPFPFPLINVPSSCPFFSPFNTASLSTTSVLLLFTSSSRFFLLSSRLCLPRSLCRLSYPWQQAATRLSRLLGF